ncbi:hypothetical protein ACX80U_12180 [Arthrobacter sp. TmT3-37]
MSARVPSGSFTRTHECGYSVTSRTAGLADRGFRTHSCQRHHLIAARTKRATQQRASEGVKRECHHKQARHEHGTRTAYILDACRCRPCRDAQAVTERVRSRQIAYGRYDSGRVEAGPVREYCFELGRQGISIKRLRTLTGLSSATLGRLMYGVPSQGLSPRARVERETAEKIMAVRPSLDLMAPGHLVPAIGTVRRLQALVCLGYSITRLGNRISMTGSNTTKVMQQDEVTARTALAVRALYDELWNKPAPCSDQRSRQSASRARNYARRNGFAPPLAWDDETIDDPAAKPEGITPTKLTTRAHRMEDLEHLLETGTGYAEILTRLGMTRSALDQAIHRAGRNDLGARLSARADERRSAAA